MLVFVLLVVVFAGPGCSAGCWSKSLLFCRSNVVVRLKLGRGGLVAGSRVASIVVRLYFNETTSSAILNVSLW